MATSVRTRLAPSYWNHPFSVPFSRDMLPSSIFLRNRHYLVFDVETQRLAEEVGGWSHIDKLGVSVACAFDSKSGQELVFREEELPKLIELMEARLVIGFNIRGFDIPVLAPYGLDAKKLDSFDIMADLVSTTRNRRISLESVARGTLGTGKSADGKLAVAWWKAGQIQKIIDYCLQDVRVTRDIFERGRQSGSVRIRYGEEPEVEVQVQWS